MSLIFQEHNDSEHSNQHGHGENWINLKFGREYGRRVDQMQHQDTTTS